MGDAVARQKRPAALGARACGSRTAFRFGFDTDHARAFGTARGAPPRGGRVGVGRGGPRRGGGSMRWARRGFRRQVATLEATLADVSSPRVLVPVAQHGGLALAQWGKR